ncbi:MAG: YjjG family noncanonical pyrimidine nucleotidase [Chitinophagaceae bacterium]|nr:YjjG family noncanonical pyrimidine nucleotidase [Chitinophagaceae bacterium]
MTKNSKIPAQLRYRHLFFDLDHTLWDFEANAKDCISEIYTSYGLAQKINDSFDDFYRIYSGHNAQLWSRFEKGYITVDELKWKRMWRTLLDFKIADEKLAKEMSFAYLDLLPTKSKVFDYTFEILDYLRDKGYELHLLTNGFEKTQHRKLESSKLGKYFNGVITSETANSMKPKKEIFEFALKKCNGRIEDSIMIGDNIDADIAGARNVGMDCVFVNHTHRKVDARSTFEIIHLKELEDIL